MPRLETEFLLPTSRQQQHPRVRRSTRRVYGVLTLLAVLSVAYVQRAYFSVPTTGFVAKVHSEPSAHTQHGLQAQINLKATEYHTTKSAVVGAELLSLREQLKQVLNGDHTPVDLAASAKIHAAAPATAASYYPIDIASSAKIHDTVTGTKPKKGRKAWTGKSTKSRKKMKTLKAERLKARYISAVEVASSEKTLVAKAGAKTGGNNVWAWLDKVDYVDINFNLNCEEKINCGRSFWCQGGEGEWTMPLSAPDGAVGDRLHHFLNKNSTEKQAAVAGRVGELGDKLSVMGDKLSAALEPDAIKAKIKTVGLCAMKGAACALMKQVGATGAASMTEVDVAIFKQGTGDNSEVHFKLSSPGEGITIGPEAMQLNIKYLDVAVQKGNGFSVKGEGSASLFKGGLLQIPEFGFDLSGNKEALVVDFNLKASGKDGKYTKRFLGMKFLHVRDFEVEGRLETTPFYLDLGMNSEWCIGSYENCNDDKTSDIVRGTAAMDVTTSAGTDTEPGRLGFSATLTCEKISVKQLLRAFGSKFEFLISLADKLGPAAGKSLDDISLHIAVEYPTQLTLTAKVTIPDLGDITMVYAANGDVTNSTATTDWAFLVHVDVKDIGEKINKFMSKGKDTDAVALVEEDNHEKSDPGLAELFAGAGGDITFKWCQTVNATACLPLLEHALLDPNLKSVPSPAAMPNGLQLSAVGVHVPTVCSTYSKVPFVICKVFKATHAKTIDFTLKLGLFADGTEMQATILPKPQATIALRNKEGTPIAGVDIDRIEMVLGVSKTMIKGQCDCKFGTAKVHRSSVKSSPIDAEEMDQEKEYHEGGRWDFANLCEYDPAHLARDEGVGRRQLAEHNGHSYEDNFMGFDSCPYARDGVCDESPNVETLTEREWEFCPDCVEKVKNDMEGLLGMASINCEDYICGALPYIRSTTTGAAGETVVKMSVKGLCAHRDKTGSGRAPDNTTFNSKYGSKAYDPFCVHCFPGTDTTDCGDRGHGAKTVSPGKTGQAKKAASFFGSDCEEFPQRACDKSDRRRTCRSKHTEEECVDHTSEFRLFKGRVEPLTKHDRICEWKQRPVISVVTTTWGSLHLLNKSITFPRAGLVVEIGEPKKGSAVPQWSWEIVDDTDDANEVRLMASKEWVEGFMHMPTFHLHEASVSGHLAIEPLNASFKLNTGWCLGTFANCKADQKDSTVTGDSMIDFSAVDDNIKFHGSLSADGSTVQGLASGLMGKFAKNPLALLSKISTDLPKAIIPGCQLELLASNAGDVAIYAAVKDVPGLDTLAIAAVINTKDPTVKTYAVTAQVADIAKVANSLLGTTYFKESFLKGVGGGVTYVHEECSERTEAMLATGKAAAEPEAAADVECPDLLDPFTTIPADLKSEWVGHKSGATTINAHTAVPACEFSMHWDPKAPKGGKGELDCEESTVGALFDMLFRGGKMSSMLAKIGNGNIPNMRIPSAKVSLSVQKNGDDDYITIAGKFGVSTPGVSQISFAWVQDKSDSLTLVETTMDSLGEAFGAAVPGMSESIFAHVGASVTYRKGNVLLLDKLKNTAVHDDLDSWAETPEGVSLSVKADLPIPTECAKQDLVCKFFKLFGTNFIHSTLDYDSEEKMLEVVAKPDHAELGLCLSGIGPMCKDKFTLAELKPVSSDLQWHTDTNDLDAYAITKVSLFSGLIPLPDVSVKIHVEDFKFEEMDVQFIGVEDMPAALQPNTTHALDSKAAGWGPMMRGFGVNWKSPVLFGEIRMRPFYADIKTEAGWCFGSMDECGDSSSEKVLNGAMTFAINKAEVAASLDVKHLSLGRLMYGALYGKMPKIAEKLVGLVGSAADMSLKDVSGKIKLPNPITKDATGATMTTKDILTGTEIQFTGTTVPTKCPMDGSEGPMQTFLACLLAMGVPSMTGSVMVNANELQLSIGTAKKQISPPLGFKEINMGKLGNWKPPELWVSNLDGNMGMAPYVNVNWDGLVSLSVGMETGIWFCGRSECNEHEYLKFGGSGSVAVDAASTASIRVSLEMQGWWWNVGFAGLTKGLSISAPEFKFLHFGDLALEADIGLNIAAVIASGGVAGLAPIVNMIKIGGMACLGSACDCAALGEEELEECEGVVAVKDNAVMGGGYLSFSATDPSAIAFTASLSKITFGTVINAFGFPDSVMTMIPKPLIESSSGMYPATGQDFAKVEFSLLGATVGGKKIPAGLVISGGAQLEIFGKTLRADGLVMAGMSGALPSLVLALQLPKLDSGLITVCKTAACEGDYGPFLYSHLGKPDASIEPKDFGSEKCTVDDKVCLEMVGYAAIDALGMSGAATNIQYTPTDWVLKQTTKFGRRNPMTFDVEVKFAVSFSEGMAYHFEAKMIKEQIAKEKTGVMAFFNKFRLLKNLVTFTGMTIAGSFEAGGGDGFKVSAKAQVHLKIGRFLWLNGGEPYGDVDIGFDIDLGMDMDGSIKEAIHKKLAEIFPRFFANECEHEDGVTSNRKGFTNSACDCGGEGGDKCSYLSPYCLGGKCRRQKLCLYSDGRSEDPDKCTCGDGGQSPANKVDTNVPGVGGWGGKCTCPDGQVYQVGDNNDSCGSIACVGGSSGKCGSDNPGGHGVKVTCAPRPVSDTCVGVEVGGGPMHGRMVDVKEGYQCPNEVSKDNWLNDETYGDTFEITQEGTKITVVRTDNGDRKAGWGMPLRISCCKLLVLPNKVDKNVPGVGGWGGKCTCPDGQVYQVGDNNDSCGSLACVGGSSGKCGSDNPGGNGVKVTCASASEDSFGDGETCGTWGWGGKGKFCNNGKCADGPICVHSDGKSRDDNKCMCGNKLCNGYCDSGTCERLPRCGNQNGEGSNGGNCRCGGDTCRSGGRYCANHGAHGKHGECNWRSFRSPPPPPPRESRRRRRSGRWWGRRLEDGGEEDALV